MNYNNVFNLFVKIYRYIYDKMELITLSDASFLYLKEGLRMKIKDRFINFAKGLRLSIDRFPIPISLSTILVITLMYLQESRMDLSAKVLESFERFSMTIGIGIILFTCISLLKERMIKDKIKETLLYLLGIVIMIIFYFIILDEINLETGIRYIGSMIFLILSFFYISRWKKERAYEKYIIRLFFNLFETFVYSGVLLFGVFAIIFTINSLFDANIDEKWYYYTFLIDFLIFGISLFLSKIPRVEEDFSDQSYSKSLKILLVYIVIPLISIYTTILYVYFAKILVLWEWPRGIVSHLVLWYSLISVAVIFFTSPLIEENKVIKSFKVFFPKIILPILVMMFISIGQRIMQYGFTEKRYFILVLGLWVTGIMIYFSLKKPLRNIIIPISLSLIVLNSVFGPLSSISVSKLSQNNRFEKILEKNDMISDGKIIKKEDVNKKDKQEINNILTYFRDRHILEDVKLLEDDFKVADTEKVFGFKFEEYNEYHEDEYFYYSREDTNSYIDIKEYDYLLEMNALYKETIKIDNLNVKMKNKQNIIISESDREIISIDLVAFIKENYEEIINFDKSFEQGESKELMPFYFENEKVKGEIIFRNLGGRIGKINEEVIIEDIDLLILLDEN